MSTSVNLDGFESPFAERGDYRACRSLHRKHGTTYFFASQLFSKRIQDRTDALYGFVRLPDEWVDNPTESIDSCKRRLFEYREELRRGLGGERPELGVLRAFCDVMRSAGIPFEEPFLFLDAMEQDLWVSRYESYEALKGYMRGSASAVGVMMSYILCDPLDPTCLAHAMALGEAMQMTNFLRDVGEDARRGRIYLPLEDLERFGVSESQILTGELTDGFRDLMRFEIQRARELYACATHGVCHLPTSGQKAVRLASILYSRILDRIEEGDFDVFTKRARTSRAEKLAVAAQVLAGIHA